jgi:hypothetical protein
MSKEAISARAAALVTRRRRISAICALSAASSRASASNAAPTIAHRRSSASFAAAFASALAPANRSSRLAGVADFRPGFSRKLLPSVELSIVTPVEIHPYRIAYSGPWTAATAVYAVELVDRSAALMYTLSCALGMVTSGGLFNRARAHNPLAKGSRFAPSPFDPLAEQRLSRPRAPHNQGALPLGTRAGDGRSPATHDQRFAALDWHKRSLAPLDTSAGNFAPGTHDLEGKRSPPRPDRTGTKALPR